MRFTATAAVAALAFATSAHAGDMTPTEVSAQTLDGAVVTAVPNTQYAVLGVVTRNGMTAYQVADSDGDVFLNFVPRELEPVITDIDEIDTYTYEYRGMTFTNRIVRDDADSVG